MKDVVLSISGAVSALIFHFHHKRSLNFMKSALRNGWSNSEDILELYVIIVVFSNASDMAFNQCLLKQQ